MDLDDDGKADILSGSYSRHDSDMAGLFQVLWGKGRGSFRKTAVLEGTDGEPLIIPATKDRVTDRICTRPTAVDLDGDGKLDLVVGNFTGTFALFRGEGKGRFAPEPEWLGGIQVDGHGDPVFVDWDQDRDLDMLSGSSQGGVFLFRNRGTAKKPDLRDRETILEPVTHQDETPFGDAFLTAPQSDTRVAVGDVDGDGRFDLLIGDDVTLNYPAGDLDVKTARTRLEEWKQEQQDLMKSLQKASTKVRSQRYRAHWDKRKQFLREDSTGFVWVMYQRAPAGGR